MGVAEAAEEQIEHEEQDAETEQPEQVEEASEGEQEEGGEQQDEHEVRIGTEEPPASEEQQQQAAAKWVKDLRRRQRELARENAELKAQLQSGKPAEQKPTLGAKPTLASSDYDEEKYQAELDKWYADKRAVEAWEADQEARSKAAQEAVRKLNEAYASSKAALKVKDYDEAEDEVVSAFNEVQQAIVKTGPANPGAVVYALGKNPKKLQELASIKDPVKFAVAVGKLETEVKVTKRSSTKPAPEETIRSGAGASGMSKGTLERLEAEAARTGDRTAVVRFKKQLEAAGKKT